MAGRLLVPGWSRALDSDGFPIAARISFFLTETDALASVYADEGLTTPLTNPVPSNSAGRFPAIWAAEDVSYDWSVEAPYGPPGTPFTGTGLTTALASEVLAADAAEAAADAAEASATQAQTAKTGADLVLAEILEVIADAPEAPSVVNKANIAGDNIAALGQQATFRANIGAVGSTALAANTGSALVGWIRAATGAVSQTLSAWLQRQDATVHDFGAVGDGVTNDTAAIQAAQTATGRIILAPGKTYVFNATIELAPNNVIACPVSRVERWFTTGSTATLKYTGSGRAIRFSSASSVHKQNVMLSGFTLDGQSAVSGNGIEFTTDGSANVAVSGIQVRDVHVKDFPGHQIYHNNVAYDVVYDRVSTSNIIRATVLDHVRIEGTGGVSQIRFNDCWISPGTAGVWAIRSNTADQLVLNDGTIAPYVAGVNGANGIYCSGGLAVRGTSIEGQGTNQLTTIGIQYVGTSGAIIEPANCVFFGTNIKIGDGTGLSASGWVINGNVSGFNAGGTADIHITAGGARRGTILSTGYANGNPTVLNDRETTDGAADVSYLHLNYVTVDRLGRTLMGYTASQFNAKLEVNGNAYLGGDVYLAGSGNFLAVNNQKVVGARGAAVANAVNAAGVPTQAEFNAFVTQFNLLAARLRVTGGHGLISD